MRFPGRQRDAPPKGAKRPTAEDFKSEAVRRAVFSKTWQHPVTLLPGALGVVGVAASAVGGSQEGLAIALGLVFVGVASWVWNFFVRGPALAEAHINSLRDLRDQIDEEEIYEIEAALQQAGFEDGAKEAQELKAAYDKLRGAIEQHFDRGDPSADRFKALAKDTYREGVRILRRALGAYQALQDVDLGQLERESRAWQKQLGKLDEGSTQARTLQRQIESHQKRISSFEEREGQLKQLIAEANDLEAVLESSSLQVFDLAGMDTSVVFGSDGSATRLERAIEAARTVEERLKGVGNSGITDDVADELRAAARKGRQ